MRINMEGGSFKKSVGINVLVFYQDLHIFEPNEVSFDQKKGYIWVIKVTF